MIEDAIVRGFQFFIYSGAAKRLFFVLLIVNNIMHCLITFKRVINDQNRTTRSKIVIFINLKLLWKPIDGAYFLKDSLSLKIFIQKRILRSFFIILTFVEVFKVVLTNLSLGFKKSERVFQ